MKPEFPSSFESEFGSVKYNVVVVVEHENGTGQIFETPITVIKTVDLNDDLTFRVTSFNISTKHRHLIIHFSVINNRFQFHRDEFRLKKPRSFINVHYSAFVTQAR